MSTSESGGIVDRYLKSSKSDDPGPKQADTEVPIESGSLIALAAGMAAMLDLRFKDGNRLAIPYAYLASVELDPKGSMTLLFTAHRATVTGRGLAAVYAAVTSQTAIAICESPSGFDPGDQHPFVEAITVEDPVGLEVAHPS